MTPFASPSAPAGTPPRRPPAPRRTTTGPRAQDQGPRREGARIRAVGPNGPFGRELACDLVGPALRPTVEYRMREGVAAQSTLHLPHDARARQAVGYGNTVLARLAPVAGDVELRLLDMAAPGLDRPARRPPPHPQALGFGLTDAVPADAGAASWPKEVGVITFAGLPAGATELLYCHFFPGDQRPQSMVVRVRQNGARGEVRWRVDWVGLRDIWNGRLGERRVVDYATLPQTVLLPEARAPQVLSNQGAGNDAGGFVLVDGPRDWTPNPFGEHGDDARVTWVRVYPYATPRFSYAVRTIGVPAVDGSVHLSAVACAANGTTALGFGPVLQLCRQFGQDPVSVVQVPAPAALAQAPDLRCQTLQLAARGRFLAASWRAQGANGSLVWRASLFACDLQRGRVLPLPVPVDPRAEMRHVTCAFLKTDLDEDDVARLCMLGLEEVDARGGIRLAQAARRLFLTDAPRTQVLFALSFDNLTQLFALDYNPAARLSDGSGVALRPLAQTYATDDPRQAAALQEHNQVAERRIYPSGAAGIALQADVTGDIYPRFYDQIDQMRDNGRLCGGLQPIVLREHRPAVVEAATRRGLRLRENRVTFGPLMSRDGRFLFAGLDGNRLHRWDFAPEENGHLLPGAFVPQLQPFWEQPRTISFAPTPVGTWVGAAPYDASLPFADPAVPTEAESWDQYLSERPYAPRQVEQEVTFDGAVTPGLDAEWFLNLPQPLDPRGWGLGDGEGKAIEARGQHLVAIHPVPDWRQPNEEGEPSGPAASGSLLRW